MEKHYNRFLVKPNKFYEVAFDPELEIVKGTSITTSLIYHRQIFVTFRSRQLTLMTSRLTVTTCQLSVEKAMARSAAATSENIEAKHNVTALQKAIFLSIFCFLEELS